MSGPYKCRNCKKEFEEGDRAISIGSRRMIKNSQYPERFKTYPVIVAGPISGAYYCEECFEKGIPLDIIHKGE